MKASSVTQRVLANSGVRSWAWWQEPLALRLYVGLVPLVAFGLTLDLSAGLVMLIAWRLAHAAPLSFTWRQPSFTAVP